MVHESTALNTLALLTSKEGEALELAARQFTNKEIARHLDISSRAVEERLRSARTKLDAPDRRSAGRRYLALLETCDQSTCGPSTVDEVQNSPHETAQETTVTPPSQLIEPDGNENYDGAQKLTFLEAYDVRFGRIGRLYAVVGLSVLMGLLLIAGVAIAVVARMLF